MVWFTVTGKVGSVMTINWMMHLDASLKLFELNELKEPATEKERDTVGES